VTIGRRDPNDVHPKLYPGSTIRMNRKDIKNVLAAAHKLNIPMPLTAKIFEIQQVLKVSGHFGVIV
jgi:2-hydroxy-3-oxopropionate reductase